MNLELLFLFEKLCLALLELRLLEVDGEGEQLTLEAGLRDRVVDDGDEVLNVRRNLHELVSGRHVKSEGRVVIDRLLTNLHDLARSLLDQVLAKDRHKH